jgi:hypothetical protein
MFFDRVVPFVMKELQSFFFGQPPFVAKRAMQERLLVRGCVEWKPALGRLAKVDWRKGQKFSVVGKRKGNEE